MSTHSKRFEKFQELIVLSSMTCLFAIQREMLGLFKHISIFVICAPARQRVHMYVGMCGRDGGAVWY